MLSAVKNDLQKFWEHIGLVADEFRNRKVKVRQYRVYEWYNERLRQITYMPQYSTDGNYWVDFDLSCSYTMVEAEDRIRLDRIHQDNLNTIKPKVHEGK